MESQINEIFQRWERYLREEYHPEPVSESAPVYKPLPASAGPKAITIEEYRQRIANKKQPEKKLTKISKKRKRGGKKLQKKKQRTEIVRLMGLSSGEEKRKLYMKLKNKI